jgi:hypothetical protein
MQHLLGQEQVVAVLVPHALAPPTTHRRAIIPTGRPARSPIGA